MARLVMVHGAFGGAWYWEPVVEPLQERGHTVEIFDLPGSGTSRFSSCASSEPVK